MCFSEALMLGIINKKMWHLFDRLINGVLRIWYFVDKWLFYKQFELSICMSMNAQVPTSPLFVLVMLFQGSVLLLLSKTHA